MVCSTMGGTRYHHQQGSDNMSEPTETPEMQESQSSVVVSVVSQSSVSDQSVICWVSVLHQLPNFQTSDGPSFFCPFSQWRNIIIRLL
jgi:hypothetical protein